MDNLLDKAASALAARAKKAKIKDVTDIPQKALDVAAVEIMKKAKENLVFIVPDLWLP
ncbi:hypothetical protein D3C86_2169040 [compost metagenome]